MPVASRSTRAIPAPATPFNSFGTLIPRVFLLWQKLDRCFSAVIPGEANDINRQFFAAPNSERL
jgi:hypothetical protein